MEIVTRLYKRRSLEPTVRTWSKYFLWLRKHHTPKSCRGKQSPRLIMIVLFVIAVLLIAGYVFWSKKSTAGLPPGPPALPFLGNALQMHQNQFLTVTKWKEQYGDTVTVFIGTRPLVVLHNLDTVKQTFNEETTTGRDSKFLGNLYPGKGIVMNQGEVWREHRRFAMSTLRDLGMGKSSLEEHILAEAEGLCSVLREFADEPILPQPYVNLSVANVICALAFGKRFSHADEKFRKLISLFNENVRLLTDDQILQTFPFLKHVPGKFRHSYTRIRENAMILSRFLTGLINDHRKKFVSGDVRDYIDSYLRQAQQHEEAGTASTFDETQLMVSVLDMFGAGTETTSTTLLWSLVYMVNHPEVQQRVQEEIDSRFGRHTVIRMDHKVSLPYTEATILEVQRVCSLVPFGVPHKTLEDVTIDGYKIPVGTTIAMNIHSIHHDPRYWNKPADFDPTRFLDADGKVTKPAAFIPFAIGKRVCLGEALAKMELFLFFSNILRNFKVESANGVIPRTDAFSTGIVTSPLPFEVTFVPR